MSALEGLADIAIPPPVSWMPQTWAWKVMAVMAMLALVAWAWRSRTRALANRYRTEAIRLLDEIEPRVADPRTRPVTIVAIAELIKRTALAAYARTEVAWLYGPAWVQFIRDKGFRASDGPDRLLDDAEYRPAEALAAVGESDARAFARAARDWIRSHRVSA